MASSYTPSLKKNPDPLFPHALIVDYRKYLKAIHNPHLMKNMNADKRQQFQEFARNHSIIIPARVNGKQTSLKVRTCIAALHCFIVGGEDVKDHKQFIYDAVHRISQQWFGEDGKGLGGYVQDTLIRECFDNEEKTMFDFIVSVLNTECTSPNGGSDAS